MVLRPGERVHLEVLTEAIQDDEGRPSLTRPVDVDALVADVVTRGWVVTGREDLVGQPIDYGYGEEPSQRQAMADDCRLEVEAR